MRIISEKRLIEFYSSRKTTTEMKIAKRDLDAWLVIARKIRWDNFGSLKQTFGSADAVGNCVVFDVGNNRYRLIGRVNFRAGIIYVLAVMDHAEYDKRRWIDSCGCHRPPPARPTRDQLRRPS